MPPNQTAIALLCRPRVPDSAPIRYALEYFGLEVPERDSMAALLRWLGHARGAAQAKFREIVKRTLPQSYIGSDYAKLLRAWHAMRDIGIFDDDRFGMSLTLHRAGRTYLLPLGSK